MQRFLATLLFLVGVQVCVGHVSLTFPPARQPNYDFLDNVRTGGPCGVPDPGDDAVVTTFATNSTFDISFHLAYPHRGGVLINILHPNGSVLHMLKQHWNQTRDSTTNSVQVTLPAGFTCEKCVLQLLRQAGEWIFDGGYIFWSCADISIQDGDECNQNTCSDNGQCVNGLCVCDSLYSGKFCQFKDECASSQDCNNRGSCINIDGTSFPRKQCFCNAGYFGNQCSQESTLIDATIDETKYIIHRRLGDRLQMWSRIIEDDEEIEVALQVNATGYIAFGWRTPATTAACRQEAPGPYAVGSNPLWPQSPIGSIIGVSGIYDQSIEPQGAEEQEEQEEEQEEQEEEEEEEEEEAEEGNGGGSMHAMDCTDIVIGTARGNQYRIFDYYTRDRSTPRMDEFYGGSQSLTAAVGKEENGITTIIFRKPLSADDVADHAINRELLHVIWSFGQVFPDYFHAPGSGIEAGTANNQMFYQPDEIKYHGTRNRGTTSINFYERDLTSEEECRGEYSTGCDSDGEECQYKATWRVTSDHVIFDVTARIEEGQWVAIGFSDDRMMANTDVVVGSISGRDTLIQDRWSTLRGVEPQVDSTSNLLSTSVARENGYTTISFARRKNTEDTQEDIDLSNSEGRFFIYGWGGTVNFDTNTIGYHPATPIVSTERVVIPSSARCTAQFEGNGAGTVTVSFLLLLLCLVLAYLM